MLIDYLPEFMQELKEIKVLLATEESYIDEYKIDVERVFNDQYFLQAEDEGLKHFEKMLGIVPKLTDSLETRRFRIYTRFNESLPYTEITLNRQLEALCGKGGYKMTLVYNEYKIIVKIALISKGMLDEVDKMLRKVVPANLIIDLALLYNQHLHFEGMTHEEMEKYRHIDLREEVV